MAKSSRHLKPSITQDPMSRKGSRKELLKSWSTGGRMREQQNDAGIIYLGTENPRLGAQAQVLRGRY